MTKETTNAVSTPAIETAANTVIETENQPTPDPLAELDPAEYAVDVAARYEAELAETRLANLAAGNYKTKIGDETVEFKNFKIAGIDSPKYELSFRNSFFGRKMFYWGNSVIARNKIAEMYMANEQADEQDKIFRAFNKSVPDDGNLFNAYVSVRYADGRAHTYGHDFDYFTHAQEYVDALKKLAADNNCEFGYAMIKRRGQYGHIFFYQVNDEIASCDLNEPVNADDDTEVFSLLPDVDELNDVDDEPETEISEPEPETPAPANVEEPEADESESYMILSAIDYFDETDDAELLAELKHDIEWLPDIADYRVDAEHGVFVTCPVRFGHAIASTEQLFDSYGLRYRTDFFKAKKYVEPAPEIESKARIDDFDDKFTRICKVLEALEEICADFDDDNIDFAEDEDIAFHNLLCVQHVKDAMKDLYEMGAWYDDQIETAYRLLKAE